MWISNKCCILASRLLNSHCHQVSRIHILRCFTNITRSHPSLRSNGNTIVHHRKLHLTQLKHSKSEPSGLRNDILKVAIYGSFAVGGVIMAAIFMREIQDQRRKWKGIEFLKIPEWGRMRLFSYKGYVLPEMVVNVLDEMEKFETSAEDLWIVSYPRSGTTWLQEVAYLIHSDMDLDTASRQHLDDRWGYLEFMYPGIKELQKQPSPRLIKSHLPYTLLPPSVHEKKPKIIYIARNPKDVVVSYYYFTRLLHPVTRYKGDFEQYFKLFMKDQVMYSPWTKHVLEFWERRNEDNILFIMYEDLKKDTAGMIDKIAAFLGKSITPDQKRQILEHCSFENMKSNPQTNYNWLIKWGVSNPKEGEFMRKGCIGDWSNHLTDNMNNEINYMLAQKFVNSDIQFSFSGTHFKPDDKPS